MVGDAASAAIKVIIERIKNVIVRQVGGVKREKKDAGIRDVRGEQENLESDKYNRNII